MTRDEVLRRAKEAVCDREGPYGPPRDCFAAIAARWSLTLGITVSPAQVALCMIDLKMARLTHNPKHADSIIDIPGYAACLGEIVDA